MSPDGDSSPEDFVVRARNRRGRDIDCRVSITPLGVDGSIGGAILLMEQQAPG
jgi:hypothetical protein